MFYITRGPKHCLDNVGLIPPCDRVLLEMLYLELSKWATNSLRNHILAAETTISKYNTHVLNGRGDSEKVYF